MRCQPKGVGKMAEFETLTLCISLNSSPMWTYFCKDLVTEYCLYLIKKMIPHFDPLYLPKFKSHVDLFLQGLSNRVLSVPGKENDSQL